MAGLKYKTFSELMASVSEDLHSFDDNNLIVPKRYIKTIRTCNSTLGIKINQQAETMLEVSNYKADMPENLLSIISLIALSVERVGNLHGGVLGTHLVHNTYEEIVTKGITPTVGCVNGCNECYWMTRQYTSDIIFKDNIKTLKPTKASLKWFSETSPNRNRWAGNEYHVDVAEDSLNFDFESGNIHIAYLADLVDEEGELLLLDHPLTDDYYEWSVKTKIFQDLWHNTEADVQNKLQDARVQLGAAKQRAVEIVATPEYRKLKEYTNKILMDYYNTYMRMFI